MNERAYHNEHLEEEINDDPFAARERTKTVDHLYLHPITGQPFTYEDIKHQKEQQIDVLKDYLRDQIDF